jgi:exodeoxyribonuclease-3
MADLSDLSNCHAREHSTWIPRVKIATWNVNSLRAREDHVLDWVEHNKPDVLCLQETKCTDQEFPEDAFGDLNYDVTFFGQRSYNGVAIASRPEMFEIVKGFPGDPGDQERRMISAKIEGVRVVCVYAPNGQSLDSDRFPMKLEWYRRLKQWLGEVSSPDAPLVICGDFNVAPADLDVYDPAAVKERILCSTKERNALSDLMSFGLTDAFRHTDPKTRKFTWWDYRSSSFERNLGLRIDHFLITKPIVDRLTRVKIDEGVRGMKNPSDHVPVILEVS